MVPNSVSELSCVHSQRQCLDPVGCAWYLDHAAKGLVQGSDLRFAGTLICRGTLGCLRSAPGHGPVYVRLRKSQSPTCVPAGEGGVEIDTGRPRLRPGRG